MAKCPALSKGFDFYIPECVCKNSNANWTYVITKLA